MFAKLSASWLACLLVLGTLGWSCKSKRATSDDTAGAAAPAGEAATDIRIGVLLPLSGPFAATGSQIDAGIRAWLAQHGDTVAGKKLELLVKDTMGAPDVAKRLAQGLLVREQVHFLAGFVLTPVAMAVAPIATQAKTPMIIMNAATSSITTKSPYVVRISLTLPQVTAPLATWAANNGMKSVYTLVSDYGPGIDAETQFKQTFEAAGGSIAGAVRVPLQNPDFAPYLQRVKDQKPEAVFVFVPAGQQGTAFMKAFQERGLGEAGIQVIATGDVTEDHQLPAMGETALGVVTTHHYSAAHDSPENAAFKTAFAKLTGNTMRPNFMAVGGYDGMAAIAAVAEKLGGNLDGERAIDAFKGLELVSPRGAIRIDPETRDVVQTVYVRRVERREDGIYNVEFEKFPQQKDPGKLAPAAGP